MYTHHVSVERREARENRHDLEQITLRPKKSTGLVLLRVPLTFGRGTIPNNKLSAQAEMQSCRLTCREKYKYDDTRAVGCPWAFRATHSPAVLSDYRKSIAIPWCDAAQQDLHRRSG